MITNGFREELLKALNRLIGSRYIENDGIFEVVDSQGRGSDWVELIGTIDEPKWAEFVAAVRLAERLQYELDLSAILIVQYDGVVVDEQGKRLYGKQAWEAERMVPGDPKYLVNGQTVHKDKFDRLKQLQQEHRRK